VTSQTTTTGPREKRQWERKRFCTAKEMLQSFTSLPRRLELDLIPFATDSHWYKPDIELTSTQKGVSGQSRSKWHSNSAHCSLAHLGPHTGTRASCEPWTVFVRPANAFSMPYITKS